MKHFYATLFLTIVAVPSAPSLGQSSWSNPTEGANPKNIPTRMDDLVNFTQKNSVDRAVKLNRDQGRLRAAKAAEVMSGLTVADEAGVQLGSVAAVGPDGAIVQTARGKVKLPLDAFGVNKSGLVIGMSKEAFDKLVAHALAG